MACILLYVKRRNLCMCRVNFAFDLKWSWINYRNIQGPQKLFRTKQSSIVEETGERVRVLYFQLHILFIAQNFVSIFFPLPRSKQEAENNLLCRASRWNDKQVGPASSLSDSPAFHMLLWLLSGNVAGSKNKLLANSF